MYNRFTRGRGLFGGLDLKQVSEVANGASSAYAQITQGATALTGTLRGIYAVVTNGPTAGTGVIQAGEFKARAADPAGVGANIAGLTGVYISVDVKAKVGTTIRGLEVSLDGGAGGSSTLAQGIVIFNNSSAVQTASIAVDINGGTATDHKAFTYDLRLQTGATISNATSGVVAISGALEVETIQATATGHLFLETVAIDAQVRINSRTFTGTATDSIIGLQVKPRAGDNRTAGIFGAEFEPGVNEGFTGTSLVGVASRPVIKASGASAGGNLSGDVRAYEASVGTYSTSTRTIGGTMSALWASNNAYGTITGGVYVIHVPATAGGTVPWSGFANLVADSALAAEATGGGASLPANVGWLRVKLGATFYKLPAYNN